MDTQLPKVSKLFDNISRDVDSRGEILSIVDQTVQNVSIITCNPNTIRSNHYHIEDFHFMYVIDGEIDYFFCDVGSENIKYQKVAKGQTIFTPPNEIHATYFPVKTKLIVSSRNPRDKVTYENDTRRVTIITPENVQMLLESLANA